MIYELAVVAKEKLSEDGAAAITSLVREVLSQHKGELLIEDDWGKRVFAQPTSTGIAKGHYLYYLFKSSDCANNPELERRLRISDDVLKQIIFKVGDDREMDKILKNFKTPYSKKYRGSVTEDADDADAEKDRRRFARRKHCWFTAKNITADWKDPNTYQWLVNEFGKISPGRVSCISTKHQRFATTAIKRARQVGLISHLSNEVLQ